VAVVGGLRVKILNYDLGSIRALGPTRITGRLLLYPFSEFHGWGDVDLAFNLRKLTKIEERSNKQKTPFYYW
jgi:hypothetical protein